MSIFLISFKLLLPAKGKYKTLLKEKKLLHYGHDRVTDKRFTPSLLICREHHEKRWAGRSTSWN